jgi:hypothetical protein
VATFSAQVVDLVGAFSDETALDSFITEGANEVINAMPRSMRERVAEETSFSNTTSSEGSKVLHVLRSDGTIDQPCRRIPARHRGRIQDSSDMQYATATDPAFYIQDALVTIFPTGTGKLVSIPTYNQGSALDASSLSTITNFPNEAEYLVTLYAAMKALQQNMSGMMTLAAIDTTALGAITTELNKADDVISTAQGKVDDFYTSIGDIDDTTELWDNTNKRFTVVRDALVYAGSLIDGNKPDAAYDVAQNLLDVNVAFDGITAHLADGEAVIGANPEASAIFTALTAMNSQADQSVQALANTGVEIGLANAEVDGVTTTLAQALALTDSGSTDIATALDGMQTANAKFRADGSNPGLFGDAEWFTTGANVGMTKVKLAVDNAISLIGLSTAGDKYAAAYDLESNMLDIDTELTNEDVELANGRMQQAQTQMKAVATHLSVAQSHIAEWNATVQTLVSEINAFSSEASARYGWVSAKAVAWQGKLAAAQGYMATANGYMQQASGFNAAVQAYAGEVQARLSYASAYQQASAARGQEGQSRIAQVNVTLSVAQQELARANAAIAEINILMGSYRLDLEGVAPYLQAATGYISQAQGYVSEANTRMQREEQKYKWYQAQQAKLQADYDRGIQLLAKG